MRPKSGLCVGLDVDLERLPRAFRGGPHAFQGRDRTLPDNALAFVHSLPTTHQTSSICDTIVGFNAAIVRATQHVASCYKINLAFYEKYGREGIDALYATRELIGDSYVVADAKRGDIGNTSSAYASAIFDDLKADAITVSPYMGRDSVEPFLAYADRMVYVLALTSNPGSADFQRLVVEGRPLYEHVIDKALSWDRAGDIGFVVGGTHPRELADIRSNYSDAAFLIPGLGSQGAGEDAMVQANAGGPAVFNVSRALLYLTDADDFEQHVRAEAERLAAKLA